MIRKPQFKLSWKYALGEIILIFIDISLAIAFQNWNQKNNENKLEAIYYCQLLDDVNEDNENADQELILIESRLKAGNQLLSLLQKGEDDLEELSKYILQAVANNVNNLSVTTNALDDIKSSGNLHILRANDLKVSLLAYYDELQNILDVINANQFSVAAIRFFQHEDLINSGWVQLAESQDGFNEELIDVEALKELSSMTDELRRQLMNDALFYIAINSRNKYHFERSKTSISQMKALLEKKCNQ